MRQVILIMILSCLYSCTNPKTKIVEQEKQIKKEIESIDVNIAVLHLFWENYHRSKEDSIADKWDKYWTTRQFCIDSAEILEQKKLPLKSEYDSLEMELKKY